MALYDKGREKFLTGAINWSSDTIKVALVKSTYTADTAVDEFYSTLSTGSYVVGTPATLGTKTTTLGVADAADVTFTAVTGSAIGSLVIYKDTTVAGTSPLIAQIVTTSGGALSITPNGGDITITWDNGANKIFKL